MDKQEIKEILSLIKSKKPQGFELLYNKYFRFMFGVAYSVLNNDNDSYDVIQNVMIRLYMLEEKLFPTDHEISWLQTVIKNEALMHLRKEKPTIPIEDYFELPVQEQRIEDFVDMDAFQSLLSPLNEKQKKIITMKILGDMTHKEISNFLSMPTGTVQWIYNTSIKKLRNTLTALTCFVLGFGGAFVYQLLQYQGSTTEQPGEVGISSIPAPEPVLSPWLIIFFILFVTAIIAWILFFNFSDKMPTKGKTPGI